MEGLGYQSGVLAARRVMEVLHRHLNAQVPHPFLDTADVGAAVQQVGGETMTQAVRTGARVETGLGKVLGGLTVVRVLPGELPPGSRPWQDCDTPEDLVRAEELA